MGNPVLVRGATGRVTVRFFVGDTIGSGAEDLTGYTLSVYAAVPVHSPHPEIVTSPTGLLAGQVDLVWDESLTPRLAPGLLAYEVQLALDSPGGDREILRLRFNVS